MLQKFTRALRVTASVTVAVALGLVRPAVAQDEAVELKVGDAAPEWTLEASDGKTYSLSQFKGKQAVVLAFFPKAFTPGCTAQCKDLSEYEEKIDATGAAHFMISTDKVEDNTRFAKEYGAAFPILADPEKKVGEAYGVLMPAGFAKRWTFYIDKDGIIQHIDKAVKPNSAAEDTLKLIGDLNLGTKAE
jgi:thioredoxin-dependent peroxiredoxin